MSEYVVFSEELLRNFYDPATCSYMVPLSGKAAHDMRVLREENARLRAKVERQTIELTTLRNKNEKLRALVRDMWHDGMCECDEYGACLECEYGYLDRMQELGIEVNE